MQISSLSGAEESLTGYNDINSTREFHGFSDQWENKFVSVHTWVFEWKKNKHVLNVTLTKTPKDLVRI